MTLASDDPRAAKAALRDTMRRLRPGLATIEATQAVCARLLAELPPLGGPLAGFWPIGSELDVRPVLRHVAETGGVAALPVSGPRGTPLVFRSWDPRIPLVTGRYGIAEPDGTRPEVVPSVVLVPLLAFDRRGMRLGYGAGYYDRTLARLRQAGRVLAVGVAFAGLEVPEVPADGTDQPLDWIVTEREALRVGKVDFG